MWRPCQKISRKITIRQYLQGEGQKDDFGHPIQLHKDTDVIAEVYPYSDPIKRQAIGLTSEKAYTVIFLGTVEDDNEIILDNEIYQIVSGADYVVAKDGPLQIVVKDTGRSADG